MKIFQSLEPKRNNKIKIRHYLLSSVPAILKFSRRRNENFSCTLNGRRRVRVPGPYRRVRGATAKCLRHRRIERGPDRRRRRPVLLVRREATRYSIVLLCRSAVGIHDN